MKNITEKNLEIAKTILGMKSNNDKKCKEILENRVDYFYNVSEYNNFETAIFNVVEYLLQDDIENFGYFYNNIDEVIPGDYENLFKDLTVDLQNEFLKQLDEIITENGQDLLED